ncbi:MAG: hypothetical protein MUF31_08955 [Akkermansiaceae bacterium]|jgi:hypothetical protein|nr:hypothetical protein [Akkermansiaceae bacterium]
MNRTHIYSFAGAAAAVKLTLDRAGASAPAAAVSASGLLDSVSQALLDATLRKASDEELRELVASRVVDVVEAVEALRGSGAAESFDATLNALLEQYYAAADTLLGGGGSTSLSSSSSDSSSDSSSSDESSSGWPDTEE